MTALSLDYESFITAKAASVRSEGVDAQVIPGWMFPHQDALTRWALRKGRAAIFADTGLGKTAIELVWAENVNRATGGRVLVLAPLAVAQQIVREGSSRGIGCEYARADTGAGIIVTNYEMLHAFDASTFAGVVLDESSILKAFDGRTRNALITAFTHTRFKLCATATPAPNDFTELGNHSEFLGIKSRAEMLAEYFVHDGGSTQDWRIKGHAVGAFWRWVAGWGAAVQSPEVLGFDGSRYVLPPLRHIEHVIDEDDDTARAQGMLFADDARTLADQRRVRRATLDRRIAKAAEIVEAEGPCVIWCELNDEADGCAAAINGAVQVAGSDSADVKADRLDAFSRGDIRVLITKPSIAGFGMNWQHCARTVFVGASHSYEQTYQAIRRFWRFGQMRTVEVHTIRANTERFVVENFRRKEADAARLAASLREHVAEFVRADVVGSTAREWNPYNPSVRMTVPAWLAG